MKIAQRERESGSLFMSWQHTFPKWKINDKTTSLAQKTEIREKSLEKRFISMKHISPIYREAHISIIV